MADLRLKAFGGARPVFVLDRLTKWIIESRLSFFDTHKVIPGFFDIVRSQNRGVAFGIFNDSTSEWRTTLLVIASVAARRGGDRDAVECAQARPLLALGLVADSRRGRGKRLRPHRVRAK